MKNKVVIVTGASSGIGQATAVEFARLGARVVMAARNESKLNELAAELTGQGYSCIAVRTDVTKEEDCRNLIETSIEKFGTIDILVNNAGISMRALFRDTELAVMKQLMDVNFWGNVHCTKYALPYLLESRGTVLSVSSVGGIHGLPGRSGYSASKYAIHGFMETLRIENRKTGLHVMLISPGFTESNIRRTALLADGTSQGESPLNEKKMMTPASVAKHIVRGIRKKKRFVVLTIEGKFAFHFKKYFPGWLDRIFYNHFAREHDSPLGK